MTLVTSMIFAIGVVVAVRQFAKGVYRRFQIRMAINQIVRDRLAEFKEEFYAFKREGHTPEELARFAVELEAKHQERYG